MLPRKTLEERYFVQTLALEDSLRAEDYAAAQSLFDERERTLQELSEMGDLCPEFEVKVNAIESRILLQLDARRTTIAAQMAEAFRAQEGERVYRRAA